MKKNITFWVWGVVITLISAFCLQRVIAQKDGKSYFIDANVIYNEFDAVKDLERDMNEELTEINSYMERLSEEVKQLESELNNKSEVKENELSYYFTQRNRLDSIMFIQENWSDELQSEIHRKVWTQINKYVIDFGVENNLNYIFGATGDGTLMYAADDINISAEVIDYMNERYNGN